MGLLDPDDFWCCLHGIRLDIPTGDLRTDLTGSEG